MRSPPLPQAEGSCSLQRLGCIPPDSASAERSCREDSDRTNGCLRSVCGPAGQCRNSHEESRPVIAACGGPERNGRTQSLYSQNARPGEEAATKDPAAHGGLTLLPRMGCWRRPVPEREPPARLWMCPQRFWDLCPLRRDDCARYRSPATRPPSHPCTRRRQGSPTPSCTPKGIQCDPKSKSGNCARSAAIVEPERS